MPKQQGQRPQVNPNEEDSNTTGRNLTLTLLTTCTPYIRSATEARGRGQRSRHEPFDRSETISRNNPTVGNFSHKGFSGWKS